MGTTKDVKDRLPGLQFRVESTIRSAKTVAGTWHGTIVLRCEFRENAMFEAAIKKLDGFKVFTELAEEMVDALSEELDNTAQTLTEAQAEIEALKQEGVIKDAEIERLRGLLQSLEDDLNDPGEAIFNDVD